MNVEPERIIIVREAIPEDVPQLSALFEELDQHHVRARPEEFLSLSAPARSLAMVGEMVAAADELLAVAVSGDGEIVGLVQAMERTIAATVVSAERKVAEVDSLVVREGSRRRGVARALMGAAADWAKARGLGDVELKVRGFNTTALAFYEAIGFEPSVVRMTRKVD
jgi:ribosomal protein S18 acetylase RimI-like enzyme